MAVLVILIASLSMLFCSALDDVGARNNSESKTIEWGKPLHFSHILDSKDVKDKFFSGIILTAVIIVGLAVLTTLLLLMHWAKERCGQSSTNYNRLYDKNITSVISDVKNVSGPHKQTDQKGIQFEV